MVAEKAEWKIEKGSCYPGHKEKKLLKRYTNELKNVLANLETYRDTLNHGVHPEQAKRLLPFVHEEKQGMVAIDQRPPVGGVQLRLYIYPDLETTTVIVLAIGDKASQKSDIKDGHQFIKEFKNG